MVGFTWNGRRLWGEPGDTAATALLRNGIASFATSRKRRRPLGYSGSFVQGVLAQVDGIPNTRLDVTHVRPGMAVSTQGTWPSTQLDLLNVLRLIPSRLVRGGFEHPRLLPGGTRRFEAWEHLLRKIAGGGTLDITAPSRVPMAGRKLTVDVVVVGAGPAGVGEANAARSRGQSVVLITRGTGPGRYAQHMGQSTVPVAEGVHLLLAHEVFGIYRGGGLVAAAPHDPDQGATVVAAGQLVLATGQRSCPPVVPGNDLPGVMEAPVALELALTFGVDLGRVLVVGTGAEGQVAGRLRAAGATVIMTAPVRTLERIIGTGAVRAADIAGRRFLCDTLVHAGPWLSDPNLAFQAAGQGSLRLLQGPLAGTVRMAGAAAEPDEAPHVAAPADLRAASICPCMDVTGGEILDLLDHGMEHVEELKRQTSCGMGPCQGFPCWEMLRALIARASDGRLGQDRPSHRAPRRAITVAQAAGLADIVEPLR